VFRSTFAAGFLFNPLLNKNTVEGTLVYIHCSGFRCFAAVLLLLAGAGLAYAQYPDEYGEAPLVEPPDGYDANGAVPDAPYTAAPPGAEYVDESGLETFNPGMRNAQQPPAVQPHSSRPLSQGATPPPPPPIRDRVRPNRSGSAAPVASRAPLNSTTVSAQGNGSGNGNGQGNPMASEEKTGETPSDPVSFDFQDAPLLDVIAAISKLTGRNFDLDANLSSLTVSIITHDKIPPEMAYEVLESILTTRGYSMVESLDGHLIKIIPTADAPTSDKTPLVLEKGAEIKGYDGFSTHIVTVENGNAEEIQRVLQLLGSKNARIDVYAPTNTLIITDTADGLRRMLAFLEQADVPGFDTTMEIFTLEYTRAEVISGQINQVLLGDTGQPQRGNMPPQPVPPTPVRPMHAPHPAAVQQPGSQVIGSREEVLRMVSDERLNSLIVVATASMMERVRDLVKRLDTPTPYEANNMHIYQLVNADAEAIETAIQPLIGTAPRKQATAGGAAGGAAGMPSVGGGGGGAVGTPEVQPFEQKVQITRYDRTNSLLIVASPQDYKLLEAFIARLDVPQRQVCVDAVIMEVKMTNDFGLSVDAAAITGNDGFAMTSTDNLNGLLKTVHVAEEIVGGPRAALRGAALGLGSEQRSGLTLGVYDDLSFTYRGQKIKIPFVPLLFQAVEKITDTEVLSQPSLVTMDNEESSIIVGQEVPFITSTSSSRRTDGSVDSGMYGGYTRVERQDVGVKLKVTPQISEGDNVMVDVEIEISDTNATPVGTVDIVGPTTNKSQVTNKTIVKDGSTAVIAGLIRDTAVKKHQPKAPILADVPVFGWLFRSKSTSRQKQNMVVLVTPHIIKESMDLERISHSKIDEYYDSTVEQIVQAGFFDKILKKRSLSNDDSPTLKRAETMSGRRSSKNFKRGDIER